MRPDFHFILVKKTDTVGELDASLDMDLRQCIFRSNVALSCHQELSGVSERLLKRATQPLYIKFANSIRPFLKDVLAECDCKGTSIGRDGVGA